MDGKIFQCLQQTSPQLLILYPDSVSFWFDTFWSVDKTQLCSRGGSCFSLGDRCTCSRGSSDNARQKLLLTLFSAVHFGHNLMHTSGI